MSHYYKYLEAIPLEAVDENKLTIPEKVHQNH